MLKRSNITGILFFLFLISIADSAYADISGKVVGIADGDTITVLQNKTEYKIRLYGIDCPEKSQDFGNRAKQFTSGLVFDKSVRVIQKDIDRYKRIVGIVYVGNTCVNAQILRNGFAWLYEKYCHDPICNDWRKLESQARKEKVGLWSHPDAMPPWEFRHGAKITPSTAPGQNAGES